MMGEKDNLPNTGRLMASLGLNVVSSVGVIFINKKLVYHNADFSFGTALTVIHFIVTTLGCLFFASRGLFEIKKIPLSRVLSISLAFCGYVVFNNLSLLTNTVAFYQITKILCTPVIVFVEFMYHNKRESRPTLLALVPVCLGIFITVFADTNINAAGVLWASLAVVSNSFYTIWGKTKQQELQVSPMQILTYQAPLSAFILLFCIPFMDNWTALVEYEWTSYSFLAIGLSCVFAFGVNFSFFLFVGQTSPLTMNVVGYLKTCLVFIGGFIIFASLPSGQEFVGICLTLLGLAMYSKAKMQPVVSKPPPSDSYQHQTQSGPATKV